MIKKKMPIILMGIVLFSFVLINTPSVAEEETDIKALKKQISVLQERIDELENKEREGSSKQDTRARNAYTWNPFEEIHRMQEEMDLMFQNSFFRSGGANGIFSNQMSFDYDFDIKETDQGYTIVFDMKGLDNQKVDIEVNDQSITVKGEHLSKDAEEGENHYYASQSFGSFMRTIPIPQDADSAKIRTEKEGDKLTIFIPKKK